jgi:hypothetical protein
MNESGEAKLVDEPGAGRTVKLAKLASSTYIPTSMPPNSGKMYPRRINHLSFDQQFFCNLRMRNQDDSVTCMLHLACRAIFLCPGTQTISGHHKPSTQPEIVSEGKGGLRCLSGQAILI